MENKILCHPKFILGSNERKMLKQVQHDRRRIAFTLAEVLITLGIIGVIAALTIPTLVKNYQIKQYEIAVRKSYVTITNGFKMIIAQEGTELNQIGVFDDTNTDVFFANFDPVVRKTFKITKSCKKGETDKCPGYNAKWLANNSTGVVFGGDSAHKYTAYLADGTIFSLSPSRNCPATSHPDESKLKSRCAWILVDTNGEKGPNTFGKDIFGFGNLDSFGNIYPDTSLEWAKAQVGQDAAESYSNYWKNNPGQCGNAGKKVSEWTSSNASGQNCLARIMDNDWKIDYLD